MDDQEREQLKAIVSKLSGSSQKVRRANILLQADVNGPAWADNKSPKPIDVEPKRLRMFGSVSSNPCWLNIAENELSSITRQWVANRRIGDIETLQSETAAWAHDVSVQQRTVDWQMRLDDAR